LPVSAAKMASTDGQRVPSSASWCGLSYRLRDRRRNSLRATTQGLRAALAAGAALRAVTESDVLRSALVAVHGSDACIDAVDSTLQNDASQLGGSIKLSVRVPLPARPRIERSFAPSTRRESP
jgi:hypothetical protein